jgi:hypothetical protein
MGFCQRRWCNGDFATISSPTQFLLRQLIGVLPAISVDVDQCEAVIGEDTPVAVDAVGEVPKRHAVHLALFAIKAVDVPRCEEKRRFDLNDARDIRNRPKRVLGIEMEHDAPRNRSIEHAIGERAGLNNPLDCERFGAIVPEVASIVLELSRPMTRCPLLSKARVMGRPLPQPISRTSDPRRMDDAIVVASGTPV